jgi:hypothetical protein
MKQKSSQDTPLAGEIVENNENPNLGDTLNQISLGLKQFADQWARAAQAIMKQFEQINQTASLVQQAIGQKATNISVAIDSFFKPISDVAQWFKNIDPCCP